MSSEEAEKKIPTAIEMAQWLRERKYTVMGPRVGIYRDEAPSISKGGILLPDTSRGRLQKKTGTIIAVGKNLDPEYEEYLKIGCRVIFGKYDVMEFYVPDVNGEEYVIDLLHQIDVYFVQPPDDPDAWIQFGI